MRSGYISPHVPSGGLYVAVAWIIQSQDEDTNASNVKFTATGRILNSGVLPASWFNSSGIYRQTIRVRIDGLGLNYIDFVLRVEQANPNTVIWEVGEASRDIQHEENGLKTMRLWVFASDTLAGGAGVDVSTLDGRGDFELDPIKTQLKTASGDTVVISDGADNVPVKSLEVAINPVQDLHGYDYPWAGGAGSNIFNFESLTGNNADISGNAQKFTITATTGGYNRAIYNVDALAGMGKFYLSYQANRTAGSSNSVSSSGQYSLNGRTYYDGITGTRNYVNDSISVGDLEVSFPEGATHCRISLYINNSASEVSGGISGTFENVRLCKETGQSYTPYANICPITGWDSATVSRTGKNMLNYTALTWTPGLRDNNGNIVSSGSHFTNGISVKPSTQYTLSGSLAIELTRFRLYYLQADGTWISRTAQLGGTAYTFTTPSNCGQIQIQVGGGNTLSDAQLELGSTASDYEAYQGTTIPVTFPSDAGAVYGGTLNVTTGELTVTWVSSNLYDLTWNQTSGNHTIFGTALTNMEIPLTYDERKTGFVISCYKASSTIGISDTQMVDKSALRYNGNLYIRNSDYTDDVDSFKETLKNQTVCYKVAEPQTYHLTPQEVKTLLGTNTIWADSGNISLQYYAKSSGIYRMKGTETTNPTALGGLIFSWTGTQSEANNRSTISWKLQAAGGATTDSCVAGPLTVTINGAEVLTITSRFRIYGGGSWYKTGTTTINHDASGNAKMKTSISAAVVDTQVNTSVTAEFTLDKINATPGAPTSCTITAGHGNYVGLGDPVTIAWSGATGTITGYDVQYRRGNSGWITLRSITTSATSGSTTDTFSDTDINATGAGKTIQYRVRAKNGNLVSGWRESNSLTMSGAMDINAAGTWKTGTLWINVAGTWKRAKRVWIKDGSTWKESR